MTYREMVLKMLKTFTEDQWDSDLTVEDHTEEECYPAELRICGLEHNCLDENHPVIYH